MEDVVLVQKVGKPFTYSWLLILIALAIWMEPTHYQGMEVEMVNICRGTRYKNLWALEDKQQQINNNVSFYLYLDALWGEAVKVPRLIDVATKKYRKIIGLVMGPRAIHIQAQQDPEKKRFTT